jgi:predicted Rdx family selenoprotein
LQAAIKDKYGMTAELIEGVGGIFEVYIDGATAYSNQETFRFPENQEIFDKIDAAKT